MHKYSLKNEHVLLKTRDMQDVPSVGIDIPSGVQQVGCFHREFVAFHTTPQTWQCLPYGCRPEGHGLTSHWMSHGHHQCVEILWKDTRSRQGQERG